jgi:hypothetical protein
MLYLCSIRLRCILYSSCSYMDANKGLCMFIVIVFTNKYMLLLKLDINFYRLDLFLTVKVYPLSTV